MREYGSEHPAVILPDGYFETLCESGKESMFLRSGREALLLAALTVRKLKNNHGLKILLPAYCCWSMSAPFEKAGIKVVYYRLNEDLTIELDYLEYLLQKERPHAILTMNYYGSASTGKAIELVKKHDDKVVIIEDFSHCTFSFKWIYNSQVDIYVSSIRKSIGICDGAVILSNIPLCKGYVQKEINDFSKIRYAAQIEKNRYKWNNNQENKKDFLSAIRKGECIINKFEDVRPMSDLAKQMLRQVNGEEIAYARRENMYHLMRLLNDKVRMVPGLERCLGGAPFSLPILVENRDEVQGHLAKEGVYAPVLWPVCKEAQSVCAVSKTMGEQMLSIPIDQRYDWNDMELIAERILTVVD